MESEHKTNGVAQTEHSDTFICSEVENKQIELFVREGEWARKIRTFAKNENVNEATFIARAINERMGRIEGKVPVLFEFVG